MKAPIGALVLPLAMAFAFAGDAIAASAWDDVRAVTQEEMVLAMRAEQRLGYALDASANAVRLQAGVFFALAAAAQAGDAQRRPLRVGHKEYFFAFLEVTGHTPESAPQFVSVAQRHGEDFLIDYRRENVIAGFGRGRPPKRALSVKAGWPLAPEAPSAYFYKDTGSDPHMEVTHEQVNGYRILDFGDAIVYDDMYGITGRPTSGVLGLLFSVVGNANAVQMRAAFARDGTTVSRSTARKVLSIAQTVTIFPDGKVVSGLPDNRADLEALEARLIALELDLVYAPQDRSPMPPRP